MEIHFWRTAPGFRLPGIHKTWPSEERTSSEVLSQVMRRLPNRLGDRLLGLAAQEEVQVAAHHQVRRQRDLMGSLPAFGQELIQHPQRHRSEEHTSELQSHSF